MKVACVSNFDDDMYTEHFVKLEGKEIFQEEVAERVCALCNSLINPNGPDFYMVKADDYKLKSFTP